MLKKSLCLFIFFSIFSFLNFFSQGAKAEISLTDNPQIISAIENNNPNEVKSALMSRVSPNTKDRSGRSALMLASSLGNLEIVNILLEYRANVNFKDTDGNTALHYAAEQSNSTIISRLIAAGAKVNESDRTGITPLMRASMKGEIKNVQVLVQAGADVSREDYTGKTAVDLAREKNKGQVVSYLESQDKDSDSKSKTEQQTAPETQLKGVNPHSGEVKPEFSK